MKLSDYARKNSVTWRTAYRWFRNNQIPDAYQLPSGTIIVPDEVTDKREPGVTIVYARVSNSSRRHTDLEYQAERLVGYCMANGWTVNRVIKEVGSGLNDNRSKLNSVLNGDDNVQRLVFEHKDRLTRFGYRYIQIIARLRGIELVCVNAAEEDKDDLMQDFTSIITSFCARIYGQRRGKRKTEQLTDDLNTDNR